MCLVSFTNRLNMFLARKKNLPLMHEYRDSERNRLKVQSDTLKKYCREDIFVVKGRELGRILTVINVHRWGWGGVISEPVFCKHAFRPHGPFPLAKY